MALNRKLTPIIAGRTVQSVAQDAGMLTLTFADGSVMHIKTGGPAPAPDALAGHTVQTVQQGGTELDLNFTDKSTARVQLAEATSSVLLRDKDGNFEYAD
jgi:hypothetical protein